jgi:hypothetical protein
MTSWAPTYTWLYHESWQDPEVRWLLSTVPSAMIFDDRDVRDVAALAARPRAARHRGLERAPRCRPPPAPGASARSSGAPPTSTTRLVLGRFASVPRPHVHWHRTAVPFFGNTVATLRFDGRKAALVMETSEEVGDEGPLRRVVAQDLATR